MIQGETLSLIDEIWRSRDFHQDDPINVFNKSLINGLVASLYFQEDNDSYLKNILADRAEQGLRSIEKDQEPMVEQFFKEHEDQMPTLWKRWYANEISLNNGTLGTESGASASASAEDHLKELLDFHTNNDLQKQVFEFWR